MSTALPTAGRQTVASVLRHRVDTSPNAPFLLFDTDRAEPSTLTFAEVWELARGGAAVLSSLRVGRGDRFAVVVGNCPEFFACWFGAAILGATVVPVNPASTTDDLTYAFAHSSSKAVICGPEQLETVRNAWRGAPQAIVVTGTDFGSRAAEAVVELGHPVEPHDLLSIMYTSGTTSRPKGVMVTHANYVTAGHVVAQQLRIRADDRWMVVLPLFHANAQYYCVMSALVSGASAAVAERFSASRWPAQVSRCDATLGSLFAAPVRMILAQPNSPLDHQNRLRACLFAQNLTAEQLETFERRFGCPLRQWYGMTETIAPPLMNPLYGPHDNMTVGLPTESGRVRIVDDAGVDVEAGESGTLLVGGHPGTTLMLGYLDDATAFAEAYDDGWLNTGDVMLRRHDGFLAFRDRAKDMIKRSGENVAAAEVERVLNAHPAVFESAVVGVPDPVYGEGIKAVVVLDDQCGDIPSADQLVEFCRGHLPKGKIPDTIEFTTDLPRTSVGKIRKHLLRSGQSRPAPPQGRK